MERLVGPDVEVVLSLNEGIDFGFVNSDFLICANFGDSKLETNVFNCGTVVKFGSELVWKSTKINIKKMRTHKIPIRVEFFKIEKEERCSKPFGYVIISLKSTQYFPKGEYIALKDETFKVCGTGVEAKGCSPQLVASLRIQDIQEENEPSARTMESARTSVSECHTEKLDSSSRTTTMRGIEARHVFKLTYNFINLIWEAEMKNVHLRFHHAKAEVAWSAHDDIPVTVAGSSTSLQAISAQFSFTESPNEVMELLENHPPQVTICTISDGRPLVLAKAALSTPSLQRKEKVDSVALKNLLTTEVVGTLTFESLLTDEGEQIVMQLPITERDEALAEKFRSDLVSWKLRERQKLEQEYKEKLLCEFARVHENWSQREKELEKEAAEKMEVCRELNEQLKQVIDDVRKKENAVEKTKSELETAYQKLAEDAEREINILKEDVVDCLKKKDRIILELENEVERLQSKLEKTTSDLLTEAQTESLLREVKDLNEKLESASHAKMFFKEQWSRAVRELHRIKSTCCGDIQVKLNFHKEQLKQLGLDYLLTNNEDEENTKICGNEEQPSPSMQG